MSDISRRRVDEFLGVLVVALALSAAYVYAFPSATLIYIAGVVVHSAIGLAAVVALVAFVVRRARGWSLLQWAGWTVFAVCAALGLVLLVIGTRRAEWNWLYAHILAGLAALVLLLAWWLGNKGFLSRVRPGALARIGLCAAAAVAIAFGANYLRHQRWTDTHRIQNPSTAPLSMDNEGDGANGKFFPSSGQTVDGKRIPAQFFIESKECERCHKDIYKEWFSSAHHFSSFNNQWYRKSIEYMQDTIGVRPSKWCGGCHDPALLYSGMMDKPIRTVEFTPAGQAGLGCVMCHSVTKVKSTMGQGDYFLEYPRLDKLATSRNPIVRLLHDYLIRLNPEAHRRVFLKPFMKTQTAQFCSACHKVHLDVPVNDYRWVRGFNEYDNWQASGVSGFGARSFYYPEKPLQCANCHMPMTASHDDGNVGGFIHSHSFPAANTALPTANEDAHQLAMEENFLKGAVTVDIFALSPARNLAGGTTGTPEMATTFAVGEEAETNRKPLVEPEAVPVTAPLNRVNATVRRGDEDLVDVVVRTRKVGHFFPGGTIDAFDTWVELKATDDKGQVLFWSGRVADNGKGPVDPGAHFYRSLMIDAHGHPIDKRNAWAMRAVVYVHLIPPGAADTVHYRLHIPGNAGNKITLHARLCYRKFSWANTHFAYAGVPDPAQKDAKFAPSYDDHHYVITGAESNAYTSTVSGKLKQIPNLPIVVLSQDTVTLNVAPHSVPAEAPRVVLEKDDWTRWNDYGIGLFLQGDLKAARAAFEKITEIDPRNPDGWVNLGRVAIQEGDMTRARQVLDRALAIAPNLARANYFYARVLRNDGNYDEAAKRLRGVLAQYPEDRVVLNDLGRILFLQRQYQDAVGMLDRVLSIDPEDLQAHYNLMLCYQGLGNSALAQREHKLYLRFKADEASQQITGPYLRLHPDDNNERQAIHEHVSAPLDDLKVAVRHQHTRPAATPVASSALLNRK